MKILAICGGMRQDSNTRAAKGVTSSYVICATAKSRAF